MDERTGQLLVADDDGDGSDEADSTSECINGDDGDDGDDDGDASDAAACVDGAGNEEPKAATKF